MRGLISRVLVCGVLFGALAGARAAPNRFRVHPNPTLAIFGIAKGPDGFLWLSSADGLYRFDGFHFHKITEYPFTSARFVGFTRDGALWSGDYEGLAHTVPGGFEVLHKGELLRGFTALPDGVIVALDRLTRIGLDGASSPLPFSSLRDLTVDPNGKLWFMCRGEANVCAVDLAHPDTVARRPAPLGSDVALPVDDGRLWVATDEQAALLENGRAVRTIHRMGTHETRRTNPLMMGRDGHIWFVGETVTDLSGTVEFRDRGENARYPPLSAYQGTDRRFWVAAFGRGMMEWTVDSRWERWFPEDIAGESMVALQRESDGALLAATSTNVRRQAREDTAWRPVTHDTRRYDSVTPLDGGGHLAAVRDVGIVRLSAAGAIVEVLPDTASPIEQAREILRDRKGRIWVGSKQHLLRVEGRPGALRLRRETLPEMQDGENEQAVDLEIDGRGMLWVGYAKGIAWLDDEDHWHKIETDRPVLNLRSFTLAGDDIWVAFRLAGMFARLHRSGDMWSVMAFAADKGYSPVDTHFLKRDSRGWIWRGTPDGVHISDGTHLDPDDWIHIHLGNGLATDQTEQYGFFEDGDGSVWIAGAEGLTHLRPEASWFQAPKDAPAPKVTRVEADGRVYLFPKPLPDALPAASKVLRIDVGSLDAPAFRDRPLRYRLLPVSMEWQLSADGSLQFTDLPDESYTLEVGYAGSGPSSVSSYKFRIGQAAAPLSWMWPFGLLVAFGAAVPIVRYVPWLERTRFRVEKAIFLLRRRYGPRNLQSSPGALATAPDYTGQLFLERYRLDRMISRGGFSVVYRGRDLAAGGAGVAVKILNACPGKEGWVRDRFAHEVTALQSLHHPGVVQILDSWISADGEPCIAMPFLDGVTLRAAMDGARLDARRAARLVRQLGSTLDAAHARGIVHRDLKPENLMLLDAGPDGEQLVIIDFGTAGLRSAQNELAATTLMAGSFHYMAPERLTGHYSPSSDLFSLAVIVLEMLSGKRLADLRTMFSEEAFRPELERACREGLAEAAAKRLAALLEPALDPEPRRRPQEIGRWAEEVAAVLDQA